MSLASAPSISVLIPTFGRSKEVIDTVSGLLKQTHLPESIIVIDQNDPAFPELDRFLASSPRVRHIKSKTTGVVFNMNVALKNATTDIVLFVDDDIIPDAKLVEQHLKNYEADSASPVGIAGRVEQSGDLPLDHFHESARFHKWTGKIVTNFNGKVRAPAQIAQGVNMSFRRKTLLAAGGFDTGYIGNGYFFETDACLRVCRLGEMIFDPSAELKHLRAPSGGCRVPDKALHTSYFIRNGLLLNRRHSPAVMLPFFVLFRLGYIGAKAIYNRDARIFTLGMKAIRDGLRASLAVEANGIR